MPEIWLDREGLRLDWDRGPRQVFSLLIAWSSRLYYAGLFGHEVWHGQAEFWNIRNVIANGQMRLKYYELYGENPVHDHA